MKKRRKKSSEEKINKDKQTLRKEKNRGSRLQKNSQEQGEEESDCIKETKAQYLGEFLHLF